MKAMKCGIMTLLLASIMLPEFGPQTLAGSDVDGGTKNAQDVYIDNDDQALARVKEWYGEEFQWVLMSHYPGNQALDEAMAGLRAARGYLEPDKAFRKVLSLKSYTWDELAASYLMQSFRMLGEAEGKPEFQVLVKPTWKLYKDGNSEEDFSLAMLRMLALVPTYAEDIVTSLFGMGFRGHDSIGVLRHCMSAPGFAHEHQVLLRAILEADRKTFDKEVNNRSEGLYNNYSAFLRLCSNLELHDYVSALVEAIVDDLKHKRLSGLQTSHAVHAGSEIGHLEPFQTWLNVSEPKELRNQSSIVGMNIEVCKIPLREALDLRLGNGQVAGEESTPEGYIESVRALFQDLPGNRIEWNRNLSAWVPMRQ